MTLQSREVTKILSSLENNLCAHKDMANLLLTLQSKGNEYCYTANTEDIEIGFAHLKEYNTRGGHK